MSTCVQIRSACILMHAEQRTLDSATGDWLQSSGSVLHACFKLKLAQMCCFVVSFVGFNAVVAYKKPATGAIKCLTQYVHLNLDNLPWVIIATNRPVWVELFSRAKNCLHLGYRRNGNISDSTRNLKWEIGNCLSCVIPTVTLTGYVFILLEVLIGTPLHEQLTLISTTSRHEKNHFYDLGKVTQSAYLPNSRLLRHITRLYLSIYLRFQGFKCRQVELITGRSWFLFFADFCEQQNAQAT